MKKEISVEKILKDLLSNEFVLNGRIPLGYGAGMPVLKIRNDYLCLVVPYLKYQVTGEVDKTLVYPIRNTVTVLLPEGIPVGFEDMRLNEKFANLDFSLPVGVFRHEAIKDMTKQEYAKAKTEIFALYDKLICSLLYDGEYSDADDARLKELLSKMTEPSLKPMYRAISPDFYNKYMAY